MDNIVDIMVNSIGAVLLIFVLFEIILLFVFGFVRKSEYGEVMEYMKGCHLNTYSKRIMNDFGDEEVQYAICEHFMSGIFSYFVIGKGVVWPGSSLHKAIKKKFKQLRDAH